MIRPSEFRLAKADDVTISARTAALLVSVFAVRNLHTRLRELDQEIAVDLDALVIAAGRWGERRVRAGTINSEQLPGATSAQAAITEAVSESKLLNTRQTANLLGMTSRAVRLACDAGRLPGRKDARGCWRISEDAARNYKEGA